MHRLNDNEMLAEIMRELTKTEESKIMTSKWVLAWAKRLRCKEPNQLLSTAYVKQKTLIEENSEK